MANAINVTEVFNAIPWVILQVEIIGDGTSGDYSAQRINTVSADMGTDPILWEVDSTTNQTASGMLLWKATTNKEVLTIPPNVHSKFDLSCQGGIHGGISAVGAGATGDLLITTQGLNGGGAGSPGHITLRIKLRRYV